MANHNLPTPRSVLPTGQKSMKTQMTNKSRALEPEMRTPGGNEKRRRGKRAPGSRLTQEQVDEIFRRFHKADPNPKTELHYRDPFTLLVAVVLSAQPTESSVNSAKPKVFR